MKAQGPARELPMLAQITAPGTDSMLICRSIPVRPPSQRHAGEFSGPMGKRHLSRPDALHALAAAAAAWKFLREGEPGKSEQALDLLYALGRRIRSAEGEPELSEIEREIDKVLQMQRVKAAAGDENALDVTTLNVAAHRLQSLVHDRRTLLAARSDGKAMA